MKTRNKLSGWELAGQAGVDSGQILLGDPCYFLTKEKYQELLDIRKQDEFKSASVVLPYRMASGVVVDSGYGDGNYNVYIKKNHEGRVMEARIVFITHEEE